MILSPALNRACRAAGITPEILREQYKGRDTVQRRFHAYHHLVIVERFSFPKAGRILHRDHTTILYGARKHSAEHYGTDMRASKADLIAAFWSDPWAALYWSSQIPQPVVEIGTAAEHEKDEAA